MKIIAVDPGKTCGLAEMDTHGNVFTEELSWYDCLSYVHERLRAGAVDLLACESFVISQRTLSGTRQYDALHAIGAMRYLALQYRTDFRLVTPAASKRFSTDDKLRKLGWYFPSSGGHRNDAARVLLWAAVNEGALDRTELLPKHCDLDSCPDHTR